MLLPSNSSGNSGTDRARVFRVRFNPPVSDGEGGSRRRRRQKQIERFKEFSDFVAKVVALEHATVIPVDRLVERSAQELDEGRVDDVLPFGKRRLKAGADASIEFGHPEIDRIVEDALD
jgi:hypothetical protein